MSRSARSKMRPRRKRGKTRMDTIFHVQFPGLGLEFTVDRVALSLGGFNIYWYGVLIAHFT